MNDDYVTLRKRVLQRGLLKKNEWWYVRMFLIFFALFCTGAVFVVLYNHWPVQLALIVFLSFISVQFGFIGHDAGHQCVSDKNWWNTLFGHAAMTVIGGVNFNYWKKQHNLHHAHSNIDGIDPDIEHILSFTPEQAKRRKGILRFVTKHQVFFFIPVHAFATIVPRINSFIYVSTLHGAAFFAETLLLILHYAIWIIAPLFIIGVLKTIILYVISSFLTGLYFSFVFAPNHIGMPTLQKDKRLPFFLLQAVTSRNIKSTWLTTFLFGGLNYQIEHHLFPTMSRNKLIQAQKITERYFKEKSLRYENVTAAQAYKDIFKHMAVISALV